MNFSGLLDDLYTYHFFSLLQTCLECVQETSILTRLFVVHFLYITKVFALIRITQQFGF